MFRAGPPSPAMGLAACQSISGQVSAPYVSRGGLYALKPMNDGFAAVFKGRRTTIAIELANAQGQPPA